MASDRIKSLRRVRAGDLIPNPRNWRRHPERQQKAMRAIVAEVGFADALLARETDAGLMLIDGHLRAGLEPDQKVPVLVLDLDEAEADKLLATLDPLAALAETDLDAMRDLMSGIEFEHADLDAIVASLLDGGIEDDADIDEDEAPAPPETPFTQPGDLWKLGDHRLLCGDAGSEQDVDRLLSGEQVHLVNTDPPYNVKVEPRSNNAFVTGETSFHPVPASKNQKKAVKRTTKKLRAKDRPLTNDNVSDERFTELLTAWFATIARVLLPGRGFYIWGGYANCANYPPALKAAGLYFSQSIIWHKQHPVLTRKDFMGDHEWCFYGWREGAAHQWLGPTNATDLWSVKKVNPQSMVHLTEKPVELAARAIQYSTRKGERVLDLFGGSGSTLMAAEQTQRTAFLMELDPAYCDVIIQRWMALTNQSAVREDGTEFPEPSKQEAA